MIKLKCLLVLFLVIPGCITLNTPAKADYVFCHGQQGIGPAYFAFAWQGKSGEFESKGWYELGYGDCITPWKGKPGTYFLHADPKGDADITIIRKSGETETTFDICTSPEAFSDLGFEDCRSRGLDASPFLAICLTEDYSGADSRLTHVFVDQTNATKLDIYVSTFSPPPDFINKSLIMNLAPGEGGDKAYSGLCR